MSHANPMKQCHFGEIRQRVCIQTCFRLLVVSPKHGIIFVRCLTSPDSTRREDIVHRLLYNVELFMNL